MAFLWEMVGGEGQNGYFCTAFREKLACRRVGKGE